MTSFLGDWFGDKDELTKIKDAYNNAAPFPFVVIPNFFKQDVAEQIYGCFPKAEGTDASQFIKDGWCVYDNPIEGKLAMNNFDEIHKHGVILHLWTFKMPILVFIILVFSYLIFLNIIFLSIICSI
jgi:hypothetical protein